MKNLQLAASAYEHLAHGLHHGAGSVMLLLFRLVMGVQWIQTGWGKLNNLDGVTAYFESLNIPVAGLNAGLVAGIEFGGGILLILGLGSRLTMIPLAVTMIVALLTAELPAIIGNFPPDTFTTNEPGLGSVIFALFADPTPLLLAPAFHFLLPVLLVLVIGPGHLSVDGLLSWVWKRQHAAEA